MKKSPTSYDISMKLDTQADRLYEQVGIDILTILRSHNDSKEMSDLIAFYFKEN